LPNDACHALMNFRMMSRDTAQYTPETHRCSSSPCRSPGSTDRSIPFSVVPFDFLLFIDDIVEKMEILNSFESLDHVYLFFQVSLSPPHAPSTGNNPIVLPSVIVPKIPLNYGFLLNRCFEFAYLISC